MVKRPIHMHLITETLDEQKLLEHFQKMQIAFTESVLTENGLSSEEQGQLIYAVRKMLEHPSAEYQERMHTA